MTKYLFEILVPTVKPNNMIRGKNKFFSLRYHKRWDRKVLDIAGGLTIYNPTLNGYWISNNNVLYTEKCIPVRIFCSIENMDKIADITAIHYCQKAIMYYLISSQVFIKSYHI